MAGNELYEFDASTQVPVFIGRNAHGDLAWTTDAIGSVSASATYDPFGNMVLSAGSIPSWRWQGSWQDPATALYYVVARWYAPTLGTFLSQDPLAGATTNPQSRDAYTYGAGDPVNRSDPDGRCVIEDGVRFACGESASIRSAILARLAQNEARQKARQKSLQKYRDILGWMVQQMKMHARGEGSNGAGVGYSVYHCTSCDQGGVVNFYLMTALAGKNRTVESVGNILQNLPINLFYWANPFNWFTSLPVVSQAVVSSDVDAAMTYGTMFASNPCSDRPGDLFTTWSRVSGLKCGSWDDKYALSRIGGFFEFGSDHKAAASTYNWTIADHHQSELLSYTIWGNIDFAFTGRAWGFSQQFIEAGLASSGGSGGQFGAAPNQAARTVGYDLWDRVHDANSLSTSAIQSIIDKDWRIIDSSGLTRPLDGRGYDLLALQGGRS